MQGFGEGRPEGKRLLVRRNCRWDDNIKMDLKLDGEAWTGLICLGLGTGGGACESGNEPSGLLNAGYFLTSRGPLRYFGRSLLRGVSYKRNSNCNALIQNALIPAHGRFE
jgi:hypothetical protein